MTHGSISDVSTLSGTLKKIKAHGVQNYVAVMDGDSLAWAISVSCWTIKFRLSWLLSCS